MKRVLFFVALLAFISNANAQYSFRAVVKDKTTGMAIAGAAVADNSGTGATTNDSGQVVIGNLQPGSYMFRISFVGYSPDSIRVTLPDDSWHRITLFPDETSLEEVTVISSTRDNEKIENAPIKVEVLGKEDMAEENTIKPSNIAGILGDVSGVQLQQSSAVSGNTNVRIQGLDGQYTQILRDGMPLFDGFSGGFSILQIPPLDLQQIELIKGSASTLYGGGAIGGLINLISKHPTNEQDGVITLNATTLKEEDVNAFFSKRYKKIGYSFFAGYTHQDAVDVNNDGFSDVPKLNTVNIHPRLFFYLNDKATLTLGYNGTFENRYGGDMRVIGGNTDSVHQYYEKDVTQRNTEELIFEHSLPKQVKLTIKGSLSSFNRDIESNIDDIKGRQVNYYSEASLFIPQKENSIVAGINTTGDNFILQPGSDKITIPNFYNNTLGIFAQYTLHLSHNTTIQAGLRGDHHNEYGNFALPRIALFHRFNDSWAMRGGVGLGYKTPNPLTVQNIDYRIEDLQPLPTGIKAEKSAGYNLEGNYKKEFGHGNSFFINHAFFLTQIYSPVVATQAADGKVTFSNGDKSTITKGFDTYVKLVINGFELYLGYTYIDAERKYLAQNQFVPLTPGNRAAFTAVKEIGDKWRFGIEGSYIGQQYRDGDTKTPSYFLASLMIERKFGKKFSLVVNGENLFDYRQSNYEPIYTGNITNPTFKPLWAPIDGRVINLSLKIKPFAH